ncbi:MAG: transmembrane 220 family protein [Rhodobacter sp.]|nr:transmembrane 220 family protein [Rhodobacter sp.]
MKIISIVFCVLLILFTLVQYNDPDALLWGAIYGIGALWCGIAGFRPSRLAGGWPRTLLTVCLVLGAFGVIWYWPRTPGFWRQEVWWVTETAREGMGMFIVFVGVAVAWLTSKPRAARI